MPVIQCPNCQKSLNVKQVPPGSNIKCPACGHAISLAGGGKGGAQPTAARPAASRPAGGKRLTPEDEGFDFAQIQFPSPGPVAVTHFPVDLQSLTLYQGPLPGDPLGGSGGGSGSAPDTPGASASKRGGKKGKLSPKAIALILGGVIAFLLLAVVVATFLTGSGGEAAQ